MDRRKISFDCDGVLAGGGYLEPQYRTNTIYAQKDLQAPEVVTSIHWLSNIYDIYVISTRGHEKANLGLRAWLHWVIGLNLDTIAGVITHPGIAPHEDPNAPMDKGQIIRDLGVLIHVDDDPRHVASIPGRGLLYPSEIPASQDAIGLLPTVHSWAEINAFLTTPGMEIHGTGSGLYAPASVVSPATEAFKFPSPDVEAALKHLSVN